MASYFLFILQATLLRCSIIDVCSLCVLVVSLLLILFWLIQALLLMGAKLKVDGKLFECCGGQGGALPFKVYEVSRKEEFVMAWCG